jgi:hypothetical protein
LDLRWCQRHPSVRLTDLTHKPEEWEGCSFGFSTHDFVDGIWDLALDFIPIHFLLLSDGLLMLRASTAPVSHARPSQYQWKSTHSLFRTCSACRCEPSSLPSATMKHSSTPLNGLISLDNHRDLCHNCFNAASFGGPLR